MGKSVVACMAALAAWAAFASPVKVILDSDMISDFDDVGALACLHAMADAGECEILATLSCTRANRSIAAIEILNAYYGRPDIPVGCAKGMGVSGSGPEPSARDCPLDRGGHAKYVRLAKDHPQWVRHLDSDTAPDANEVYRRVLAAQPDHSVVICSIGFLTNIRRLLETKPDDISPLDGKALVAKKVKRWVAMACNYPKGKEYNSRYDAESSRIALDEWPTDVVFSDFQYGRDVYTGRRIAEDPKASGPVKEIFVRSLMPRSQCTDTTWDRLAGHPSWDETAVLAAVRGAASYFATERGTYGMVGKDGDDEWTADPVSGRHLRLVERVPKAEVGQVIDELMCRPPKHLAKDGAASAAAKRYEAKWESLDRRPTPAWWTDAKFGIFIHWGPYAVPAFAPVPKDGKFNWDCYAEWYQGKQGVKAFSDFHNTFYHGAPYANFAAAFKAEHFDPDAWADLFRRAGAKYVVLTSKHHDGYALWPSPESPYYNAKAMGSGRDLAGEFCAAMRKAGLKRGFYFSMLEYANPLYPALRDGKSDTALTIEEWNARVNFPQLKELAENYEADIIWPDGEWDYPSARHCSEKYLAWLFNESKVRDTVVVNDRWGKECRGRHGGHYTTEYALEGGDTSGDSATHPWEECRGIGNSFGYNRFETPDHYMTRERCVETLVSCVSRGGNLLLNVGPTADGRIPAIMQDRLLAIGAWLKVNGEAIYGSKRWNAAPKDFAKKKIYFTAKDGAVYAIVFAKDLDKVTVPGLGSAKGVAMLGTDRKVETATAGNDLVITLPAFAPGAAPVEFAPTFRIDLK